jgi:hypothetical protein
MTLKLLIPDGLSLSVVHLCSREAVAAVSFTSVSAAQFRNGTEHTTDAHRRIFSR